ncbi:UNVERIFIED_CONTAM: hypothetical protein GTU68_053232 [Idotea baltica]|nr:hypothetical protein [Idotea baltica]
MMGAERRSMLLSEEDKKTTAYHESGHALVAKKLKNSDPVHKLTIIPRGQALGLMQQLPENDKHTYSRAYWLDQLAVFFGGRVAEKLIFNQMNTGASSDISRATQIARRMVTEWGMSDKVGAIHYSAKEGNQFLGRDMGGGSREHSESTQVEIDNEVKRILRESEELAHKIIEENMDTLHSLAKALLEKETLDSAQIEKVMNGEELEAEVEKKDEKANSEDKVEEEKTEKESLKKEETSKEDTEKKDD